jgi:hypothetical protein
MMISAEAEQYLNYSKLSESAISENFLYYIDKGWATIGSRRNSPDPFAFDHEPRIMLL